jgi:hypothetical protein
MMDMITVIIPSAKIVPEELQKLGRLPPVIYPVGKGIVFDYLIEQYRNLNILYKVVCYEEIEKVERKLAQYNNINYRIIRLNKLGDLGETIYEGLDESENQEIIINFADTIVMDNLVDSPKDCFYFTEDYQSNLWTFFEENDGVIEGVLDKKNTPESKEKKKLFIGLFKISDSKLFKNILEEAINTKNNMDSFYYALVNYSKLKPMSALETSNWYDIGHAQKYYKSNLEVKSREFNDIQIDRDRGILKKTSKDIEKFIGEILWYLKLPSDIEYVRPRIFSYSTNYDNPFVEMEYYSYHTLHELSLNGDLSFNQWMNVFGRIKFIIQDFRKYQVQDESIYLVLEDMYLTKTIERLRRLKNMPEFSPFFENIITINNIKYKSLNEICSIIKTIVPQWLYDVDKFSIIHGDLCFANILIDSNLSFVKVIDPRGKFGKFDIYGDSRYELAKLIHSIDGKYDYIIKDKFRIDVSKKNITIDFQIDESKRDFDLYDCFLLAFQEEIGKEKDKIELIEALLFLSMIPLHGENISHQYAMLGIGIKILDRLVDIRA